MIKSKRKNPWDELPRGTRRRNIISLTHDCNPMIIVSISDGKYNRYFIAGPFLTYATREQRKG